jgi:hypothetical protein
MLNVIMLSVVMLIAVMLSFVMLSVVMLCVVTMIDVMLSVVAPTRAIKSFQLTQGTVTAGEYSVWLTSMLR